MKLMMDDTVGVLCFSPTGTTRKVCRAIAKGMEYGNRRIFDLTLPEERRAIMDDPGSIADSIDHAVVGVPVYAGKIPPVAEELIKSIPGVGRRATAVVVYGNREFGIALRTLVEILTGNGFAVVTAAAFIGEHSYSEVIPVAVGRPDASDLEIADGFGRFTRSSRRSLTPDDVDAQEDVFTEMEGAPGLLPKLITDKCIKCGSCTDNCPMGIIERTTAWFYDEDAQGKCLGCMACVRVCPEAARNCDAPDPVARAVRSNLGRASKVRREPDLFT
jgi:ferredoxin